ncbi:MAG: 2-amino-4-hydroxy-6-hydroxymethyldihydropteridine diphosphokinase [Gammaproteobacteria bacterium]|nr:2-amino-4-hydroxy-6-hydroxymethyldihydropteridine diphosphokinase [Gammaproteobacteria bacterium]
MQADAAGANGEAGARRRRPHERFAVPDTYIGLGSNLDDPRAHLQRALQELDGLPETRMLARSGCYKSRPLGPQDQPDYLNMVAHLATGLEPRTLLRALQQLEAAHGRKHHLQPRWGARCLDLDLLMYDDLRMHTPELTLPHPRMHERSFVLYPLAELAPALVIPGHGPVLALRDRCRTPPIEACEEPANG